MLFSLNEFVHFVCNAQTIPIFIKYRNAIVNIQDAITKNSVLSRANPGKVKWLGDNLNWTGISDKFIAILVKPTKTIRKTRNEYF